MRKKVLGKHKEAITDLDKAISLKPDFAEAYLYRGAVNNEIGKYEVAIDDFDKAIGMNPNLADAYVSRAMAKYLLGRVEEANADFQIVLKMVRQQGNEKSETTIKKIIQELKEIK